MHSMNQFWVRKRSMGRTFSSTSWGPVALFLFIGLLLLCSTALAGPRDAQWKKVEDAIKQGLPKSAITNLEPIIQGALKDKAYAEAVKAIGRKIALEGNMQGNKP